MARTLRTQPTAMMMLPILRWGRHAAAILIARIRGNFHLIRLTPATNHNATAMTVAVTTTRLT
eukprot:5151110-Pyramimonas_sp.AAC.1